MKKSWKFWMNTKVGVFGVFFNAFLWENKGKIKQKRCSWKLLSIFFILFSNFFENFFVEVNNTNCLLRNCSRMFYTLRNDGNFWVLKKSQKFFVCFLKTKKEIVLFHLIFVCVFLHFFLFFHFFRNFSLIFPWEKNFITFS